MCPAGQVSSDRLFIRARVPHSLRFVSRSSCFALLPSISVVYARELPSLLQTLLLLCYSISQTAFVDRGDCVQKRETDMASARAALHGGGGGAGAAASTIVWNSEKRRFATPDGLAYLEYTMRKRAAAAAPAQQVMDLVHTYVPAQKRGFGLAEELCKAAFAHARDHKLLVIPSCTYISDTFIPRHPEWWDVVVPESLPSDSTRSQL